MEAETTNVKRGLRQEIVLVVLIMPKQAWVLILGGGKAKLHGSASSLSSLKLDRVYKVTIDFDYSSVLEYQQLDEVIEDLGHVEDTGHGHGSEFIRRVQRIIQ